MPASASRGLAALAVAVSALFAIQASAQCEWRLGPENAYPGLPGHVNAMTLWDPDGVGPLPLHLIAGGDGIHSAGLQNASNIAAYNGSEWGSLGAGVSGGAVHAMTLFNGQLVIAGTFTSAGGAPASRIATYNGSTFAAMGAGFNGKVSALAVVSGTLYAAGDFNASGATTTSKIARWTGSTWLPLGTGLDPADTPRALVGFNGSLWVGGTLTRAGGIPVSNLAVWNGSAWSAVPNGPNGTVNVMRVRDNGIALPQLIIGGQFTTVGLTAVRNIARMSVVGAWDALGQGPPQPVVDIAIRSTGMNTYDVAVLGQPTSGFASTTLDVLTSGTWISYATPKNFLTFGVPEVRALILYSGQYTIGLAPTSSQPTGAVCVSQRLDWYPVGPGIAGRVWAVEPFEGDLVFAGDFEHVSGQRVNRVARWNGATWSPMAEGFNGRVRDLHVYNGELYAAGGFVVERPLQEPLYNVAKWDGAEWLPYGQAAPMEPHSSFMATLAEYQGDLVAGGKVDGFLEVFRLRGIGWEWMGQGLNSSSSISFYVSELFNFGGELYAGATAPIDSFGGGSPLGWRDPAAQLWYEVDGNLGAGPSQRVNALASFDGVLYAAGANLGVSPQLWYPLATVTPTGYTVVTEIGRLGDTTEAWTLAEYRNALYVTGSFDHAGGQPASGFARLQNGTWSPVSSIEGIAWRDGAAVYNDELVLAGTLTSVGGMPTNAWARWHCDETCYADCDQTSGAGVLDIFDFLCFQDRFVSLDPYACNCDNPGAGVCDVFDFLCFQDAFVTGCP